MQGFIQAAQYMAKDRADLGHTAEYWYDVLCRWKKELSSDEFEDGSSMGTAGFVLSKTEDGSFELTRNIISFYPDSTPFVWKAGV